MSNDKDKKVTRRQILKMGAAAGAMTFVGGPLAVNWAHAQEGESPVEKKEEQALPQVPRRVLGKTGETIPILLMGAAMKLETRFDPKLAEALRFGVDYIDAADCYSGGTCETAVGNFHTRAGVRDKLWITSKSDRHDPNLNDELMATVEKAKKEGKIRHFGFSCHHGNVAELLHKAAKTSWVDAVMFRYNFREYGNKTLNEAMDACAKANVGLIAMKTQGSEASFQDAWQKFAKPGKWNKFQSVLKAVWADERIAAAVSHMDNFDKLKENIAAALDRHDLGQAENDALEQYARATRPYACDGCDQICGAAVDGPVQIGDTMRYLMYHDVYGEKDKARDLFGRLPSPARRLTGIDFRAANAACPHGVDVARHMRRAAEVFLA
jgi:predicted aldo/keto reductase-like oxidoreductase